MLFTGINNLIDIFEEVAKTRSNSQPESLSSTVSLKKINPVNDLPKTNIDNNNSKIEAKQLDRESKPIVTTTLMSSQKIAIENGPQSTPESGTKDSKATRS